LGPLAGADFLSSARIGTSAKKANAHATIVNLQQLRTDINSPVPHPCPNVVFFRSPGFACRSARRSLAQVGRHSLPYADPFSG
jgi:hypothetical protein